MQKVTLLFLHEIGVYHNDFKPDILMQSVRGRNLAIQVVDYGCAYQTTGPLRTITIPWMPLRTMCTPWSVSPQPRDSGE